MFFKKKQKTPEKQSDIILGMVLLNSDLPIDIGEFQKDLKASTDFKIGKLAGDNKSATITIGGETVAIGHMPVPVPSGDIEGTAEYTYDWPTAAEDLKGHKSHLIVSVMAGRKDPVTRYRIFTSAVSSLLRTTDAVAVYQGGQSLLIEKEAYLDSALMMSEDDLPLTLWVYIGFIKADTGNSTYTYGLKNFGLPEMEIVDSEKGLAEIGDFLCGMAHYLLVSGARFEDGQTCGRSADERIPIAVSPGEYVEGDSVKLGF